MISACCRIVSVLDAVKMLLLDLKSTVEKLSTVNLSTTRQPRPNAIVLNGHPVEEVNLFTYLGVDCRVRKAMEAFGILSPIW